jgi:predicted TIM-barrel fold metal-dependent hydrolase
MVQATEAFLNVLQGIAVVDCDTHFTEPPDLWTSRAPAKFKDRVPHVSTIENGDQWWFVDGDKPLGPLGQTVVLEGGEKILGRLGVRDFDRLDQATYLVEPRLELMDRLGIYAQIVYPNAAGFASAPFMTVRDNDLRTECIRIYNDALSEWQAQSNGRLLPQALLPFWDLDATLKEMRRAVEELHFSGFTITDTPEKFDFPDYQTQFWDPFWELASELEVPLNFHIGSGGAKGAPSPFISSPWESMGPERKMAIGATNIYMDNARMITNLLYSDIVERFPKLRFVSVESGIGWIPFVLEACEYQWDEMVPTEVKHHQLRPIEKFRRHIYACFWFEDFGPRTAIEKIGVNNVLFETDFPHPTCLYPRAQEHIANVLSDLTPTVRRRVLQDNAAELYKVRIPVTA